MTDGRRRPTSRPSGERNPGDTSGMKAGRYQEEGISVAFED
jgi:hypothetical protein